MLVVFSRIFVADTKILFVYNFAAPYTWFKFVQNYLGILQSTPLSVFFAWF